VGIGPLPGSLRIPLPVLLALAGIGVASAVDHRSWADRLAGTWLVSR
jgi:hypothetical protein